MAEVVLGRAGTEVLVDLDVCAKTGRRTRDRVTLRGTTTPGWVLVLLLFTVVGFLLARAMTSRRYSVTLPFVHDVHDRWKRNRQLAWALGLVGLCLVVVTAIAQAGPWGAIGLALVVVALIGGSVNGVRNGLGFSSDRDGDLVLSWVHPRFAEAVGSASAEPLPQSS
jgi:hypothetical protein